MKWLVMLLAVSGCESVAERSVRYGEECAIQCDFHGATSYSYNLGNERDCICTFKLGRKR